MNAILTPPPSMQLPEGMSLLRAQEILAHVERQIADLQKAKSEQELARTMYEMKFLRTQQLYLDAVNSGDYHVILLTAGNKLGKTWVQAYDLISEAFGYQPHDGTPRRRTGYDIALLLRDYDSCAMKLYREGFLQMLPPDCVKVVARTQSGVPRILQPIDPITGIEGKHIHIFTHDQDAQRLESGSWQRVGIDEPCPRRHWEGLLRGLQTTGGCCTMTMTLLEGSAWVWDDIHNGSENQGGPNKRFHSLVCDPDENKISQGGFIPDQAVDDYRATIPAELWDARVLGKALHLAGRVFKGFEQNVHIIDKHLVPEEDIPALPKALCVDPHDRLPFVMVWAYVTPADDLVIYDEWPNEPFEKITTTGYNLDDYSDIILSKPHPTWGLMDPNFGRRKSLSSGLTIAGELTVRTGIGFQTEIDDSLATGHLAITERLSYDRSKPLGALNQPKLYIHSKCRNTIQSFHNYIWEEWRGRTSEGRSPKQKPQEKFKHFVDCVRYMCVYPGIKYIGRQRNVVHTFRKPPRSRAVGGRPRLAI